MNKTVCFLIINLVAVCLSAAEVDRLDQQCRRPGRVSFIGLEMPLHHRMDKLVRHDPVVKVFPMPIGLELFALIYTEMTVLTLFRAHLGLKKEYDARLGSIVFQGQYWTPAQLFKKDIRSKIEKNFDFVKSFSGQEFEQLYEYIVATFQDDPLMK